jgi:hypothetical protein
MSQTRRFAAILAADAGFDAGQGDNVAARPRRAATA